MPKITQVTYRRVFNLGNYETAAIELTAAVNEGEVTRTVIDSLAAEALAWKQGKERQASGG